MEQLELQFDSSDEITQLKKDLKSCGHPLLLCKAMEEGDYGNVLAFCNKIKNHIIENGLVNELGWGNFSTLRRLTFHSLDKLDLANIKEVAELLAAEQVKEFSHFDPKFKPK